jgi:cysteine desulfurase / selenocysteine lyase
MPYDVSQIRADFPILARSVNGKPLVYLDNGATSQKPRAVIDALVHFYESTNANIHRGAHGLGSEATAAFEQARGRVERFIGGNNGNELIFTRNTTESVNLLAQAWGRANLKAGDEIALSVSEHHSNFVPWYMVARERGAKLVLLPLDAEGRIDVAAARGLIGGRCKVLAFTWVSNVLGGVNPVRELAALGHARGAMVFVDAAQAAPHFPLGLKDLGVDAAAFSAHKMLGPTGVGCLWAKESLLEAMPPWQGGGSMISRVTPELVTWTRLPWKFEAGTPNIADVVAFGAAVKYLKDLGWDALREHEESLCAYGLEQLAGVEGLKLYGPKQAKDRVAVFSFALEGVDAGDAGALLDAQGIEVRVGHHCAQPLMDSLGLAGLIRASAYLYNTREELDALVAGLKRAVSKLRPASPAAAKA